MTVELANRADVAVAELVDVRRTYRMGDEEVHALDGVSFAFRPGEYWAVMGSSGSGKSTLLNILGCLDRPTAGSYRVRGVDTNTLDDDRLSELRSRELGFVFQSYNLIAQLNVLENILVPLFYQDEPPADGNGARAPWRSAWGSAGGWGTGPKSSPAASSSAWPLRAR